MQTHMLWLLVYPPPLLFLLLKVFQQFSAELIYGISTKLEVKKTKTKTKKQKKLLSFEKII